MSDSKHEATYGTTDDAVDSTSYGTAFEYATLEVANTAKYSKAWWADTADRVVSTIAQAAIATLTAGAIPGLLDVDLVAVLSVSGLAGAIALLKAFAITRSGSNLS